MSLHNWQSITTIKMHQQSPEKNPAIQKHLKKRLLLPVFLVRKTKIVCDYKIFECDQLVQLKTNESN